MTDNLEFPLINGVLYSWSSIILSIGLPGGTVEQEVGIRAVDYKAAIKREKVWGAGRKICGWTRGTLEFEDPNITFITDSWFDLRELLGQGDSVGYMDQAFQVTVAYQENDGRDHSAVLYGCKLGEEDYAHTQSTGGLETKLKLNINKWIGDKHPHINPGSSVVG